MTALFNILTQNNYSCFKIYFENGNEVSYAPTAGIRVYNYTGETYKEFPETLKGLEEAIKFARI